MNIIFLKVNIALFGYPSIFAVDYESIDMKQLIFIFTVAWGAVVGSRAQDVFESAISRACPKFPLWANCWRGLISERISSISSIS